VESLVWYNRGMKRKILEGVIILILGSLVSAAWSGTKIVWQLEVAVKNIYFKLDDIDDKLKKITCRLIPDGLACDP
jgi:cell division protein FtsB